MPAERCSRILPFSIEFQQAWSVSREDGCFVAAEKRKIVVRALRVRVVRGERDRDRDHERENLSRRVIPMVGACAGKKASKMRGGQGGRRGAGLETGETYSGPYSVVASLSGKK